jgi:uncharacterized repeat protein (TIGR01451 family)
MEDKMLSNGRRSLVGVGLSLLIALVLGSVLVQTLAANKLGAANLDNSTKEVDLSEASAGQTLQYSIVISNSGDTLASMVWLTDTLPVELSVISGSLQISITTGTTTTNYSSDAGAVFWQGSLEAGNQAFINFAAVLTDAVKVGTTVTNTAVIQGDGITITRSATTTIIVYDTSATLYLPFLSKPLPTPFINPVFQLGASNSWNVSWDNPTSPGLLYELQEDDNAQFTSPTIYTEQDQLRTFTYPATTHNYFCYRVRAVSVTGINSDWSETRCVVGDYYDDFSDNSTNWAIRRQDIDDVENSAYYQNGNYVVEIDGRWDYAIASPLARAPLPPYSIETTVRLNEQDNLNTYGIIFGADYDDENAQCPSNHYDTCFNHYYRLMLIWFGGPSQLRLQLKRTDFHYPEDNGGGGETLIPFTDVNVQAPPEGPQTWRIDVAANGKIRIYVNDNLLREVRDELYITSPYFGVFAATNEYSGAEPWFDYYKVVGLPE